MSICKGMKLNDHNIFDCNKQQSEIFRLFINFIMIAQRKKTFCISKNNIVSVPIPNEHLNA